VREIVEQIALVRLQLNPDGVIDANILALLTAIRAHVGEEDYHSFEQILVRHVQFLLKEEWEKVKYEARGLWGRIWALYQRHRRKVAYERFCDTEGAVARWTE
jgi:hypothetical protein